MTGRTALALWVATIIWLLMLWQWYLSPSHGNALWHWMWGAKP